MNVSMVVARAGRADRSGSTAESGDRGFADLLERHEVPAERDEASATSPSVERRDVRRTDHRADDADVGDTAADGDDDVRREAAAVMSMVEAIGAAVALAAGDGGREDAATPEGGGPAIARPTTGAGLADDPAAPVDAAALAMAGRMAALADPSSEGAPAAGAASGDARAEASSPSTVSVGTAAVANASSEAIEAASADVVEVPSQSVLSEVEHSAGDEPAKQPSAATPSAVRLPADQVDTDPTGSGQVAADPVSADQLDVEVENEVGGSVEPPPAGDSPESPGEPEVFTATVQNSRSTDPAAAPSSAASARATPGNPASAMLDRVAAQREVEQLMARAEVRRLTASGSPLGLDVQTRDLGVIRIEAVDHGQGLHLQLGSEHASTRAMLERHLQELRDQLRHDGLGDAFVSVTDHGTQREAARQGPSSTPSAGALGASDAGTTDRSVQPVPTANSLGGAGIHIDGGVDVRI